MSEDIIEIRVSLKGRPVKELRFSEPRITIGRDPASKIFLDNPGISRRHAVIEREGHFTYLEDLESANGTYLNDAEVTRRMAVSDGDEIRIGKFLLEMSLSQDRRGTEDDSRPQGAAFEGTMVLETDQIERVMAKTKEAEQKAKETEPRHVPEPEPEPVVVGNTVTKPIPEPAPAPQVVAQFNSQTDDRPWYKTTQWIMAIGLGLGLAFGAILTWVLRV